MKISDFGVQIGEGKPGPRDAITDVPGVTVGQKTIVQNMPDGTPLYNTGVTVIMPCDGFVYDRKPVGAAFVQNGYGKTMGTIQLNELGTLESPIALTNTLNVGKVADALVGYMVREGLSRGEHIRSVNVVVGETNDGGLNTIADRAVTERDVLDAIATAGGDVAEGAVGAGRGTVCCDLKGGIGTASRILKFAGETYTIGALVQSNFGSLRDLRIGGEEAGRRIEKKIAEMKSTEDVGSIMIVIGTDLPLTHRQLTRVLKRASVGLIRTGSYLGHGSGDIFLGFSNGNCTGRERSVRKDMEAAAAGVLQDPAVAPSQRNAEGSGFVTLRAFPEDRINQVFRLCAEAVEESILNSLVNAETVKGPDGRVVHCLREFWPFPEKGYGGS